MEALELESGVAEVRGVAATKTASWDGKNSAGQTVASGMYLMVMKVDGTIVTKKPLKIGVVK